MQKFTTLTAVAAPMPIQNIDTDMIIPKQFLKTITRSGLARGLFYEMRYDIHGKKIEDFILHQAPYNNANIIVALENFGCGSSREHAPWALQDFGITCVIAPSYADIFYNNCFKNGILPVVLPRDAVDTLMQHAQSSTNQITINLAEQTVSAGNHQFAFEIDPFRKRCLLNGLDDIGLTLEKSTAIADYETALHTQRPWMQPSST